MAHPLIYILGKTQEYDFPLILTIGREPNHDEELDNSIGIINNDEFKSMKGVWTTAYTQIAKQYYGASGTARQLKNICFEKDASPIVFSNAFPMAIPNSTSNKDNIRDKQKERIPSHIVSLFNNSISKRFKLVIQHGIYESEASSLATGLIKKECHKRNMPYFSIPFFRNTNSPNIQKSLCEAKPKIINIVDEFIKTPKR